MIRDEEYERDEEFEGIEANFVYLQSGWRGILSNTCWSDIRFDEMLPQWSIQNDFEKIILSWRSFI